MFKSEEDNFTVGNHACFEIGSCNFCTLKNDKCLLHVSFQFQSKYLLKVSAMKVIDVFFFDRTVVTASDFNNCTMINCDLVNKF